MDMKICFVEIQYTFSKEVWDGMLLFWQMEDELQKGMPFSLQMLQWEEVVQQGTNLTPVIVHSEDQKGQKILTTSNLRLL